MAPEAIVVILIRAPLLSILVVPLVWSFCDAFTLPVRERFPVAPTSVSVRSLFVSPSLITSVPLFPGVERVTTGFVFESVKGVALERVSVPDALISVAPAIDPVFTIPPFVLSRVPEIVAPADSTSNPFADIIVPVPVVAKVPDVVAFPNSSIERVVDPLDLIDRRVLLTELLVSFMITADAVPWFSIEKFESIAESARVKIILLLLEVTIALPWS